MSSAGIGCSAWGAMPIYASFTRRTTDACLDSRFPARARWVRPCDGRPQGAALLPLQEQRPERRRHRGHARLLGDDEAEPESDAPDRTRALLRADLLMSLILVAAAAVTFGTFNPDAGTTFHW